jgi:hypothetical protein
MKLSTWSRNSRSRTKQIAVVEVDRINGASTEAIGEAEACEGVDEGVEEEIVVVAPEACDCTRLCRHDSLRHTGHRCICPVKQLGIRVPWLHLP